MALAILAHGVALAADPAPAAPSINPFTGQPIGGVLKPPVQPTAAPTTAAPAPVVAPAQPAQQPAVPPAPVASTASPAPAVAAPAPTPPVTVAAPVTRGGVVYQSPLSTAPNPGVTLRFDNAEIYDVLQLILGDILKVDYVIDPSVQGRITLKSTEAVSLADIYNVLENALAINNISIVRSGKTYKVTRDANAVREPLGAAAGPNSPVFQVVPVNYVQASQLVNTLRNFIGPQAALTNDATNRYLIVVDRAANVEKILDMVKILDVDYLKHVQVRLVPIDKADPTELAKELEGLFKTSGLFNIAGTDAAKVYFLPVARLNAVLVAGANTGMLNAAEQWLRNLDVDPARNLDSRVHVYQVANSNVAHLAGILRQLFGAAGGSAATPAGSSTPSTTGGSTGSSGLSSSTSSSTTASAGLGSGSNTATSDASRTITRGNVPTASGMTASGQGLAGTVQIIGDETTNSLIIRASKADYDQILKVIERLDTAPRQVLIEAMVAEVELNDTLQYGVEWWLNSMLSKDGRGAKGVLGLDGAIKPATVGTVTGASSGLNYAVLNTAGNVVGLLNLLSNDTNVNLLSAPHVMASDGKVAKIEVGSEEPIVTQVVSTPTTTTTGTNFTTSNSIQYRPTGILLEVKPTISASGRVALQVTQEVSQVGTSVEVGGSKYPNFTKRKVTTEVILEDGKTILIGGLMQDRNNDTVVGVPGLKDVPLFGALFGTTNKQRRKNELLITLTPHIVRNREEGERLTQDFQAGLKQLRAVMQKPAPTPSTSPADTGRNGEIVR